MQAALFEFLQSGTGCELVLCENDKEALNLAAVAEFLGFMPFVLPDFRAEINEDLKPFSKELFEICKILNAYHNEDLRAKFVKANSNLNENLSKNLNANSNENSNLNLNRDLNSQNASAQGFDTKVTSLNALKASVNPFLKPQNQGKKLLISPVKTLLHKLPGKKNLTNLSLNLNQKVDLNALKESFLHLGYNFVDMVQDKGEVSIRGDIIDVFSLNEESPFRILLFDDEIESIRYFDLATQKSAPRELEQIYLCPFLSFLDKDGFESLQESLEKRQNEALISDINSLGFWCMDDFFDYLSLDFVAAKKFEPADFNENLSQKITSINAKLIPEAKHFKELVSTFNQDFLNLHKNKEIFILARNEALIKARNLELEAHVKWLETTSVLNLISDKQIIFSLNPLQKKSKAKKRANLIIDELKKGDFITHEDYGVGKFLGLERIKVAGAQKEFVALLYQNNDKLLLPVENLYLIDKFIGTGSIPQLDRLGKTSFLKLKERLKEKLLLIANTLIQTAAARALIAPKKLIIDESLQQRFIESAPFDYTSDQEKSVREIFSDFRGAHIMDRLLSGDVGFGKTEVAMNALLCVVKSGFSAFFVAPTTLLAQQHLKSLKARLNPFDITIFRLDRFTSAKEKKQILAHLKDGKPCVIVGTHALLSLSCENLALVIIDEEHKFGVKQKEKLKELSKNAHLLSMSATPIPRSLNQALSKIKTYSILSTPPSARMDVRTFVKENDEALIKEAILRELRRGGQVFYIHNHIASIDSCAKFLKELVPSLKILILHSKIESKITEERMLEFEDKKYDLLLSTSIVESGIDLPNANTIIIEQANKFGMADLHQLRGRVGRSDKQGYCYFLIEDKGSLSPEALKRLISLESNSFLGAGSILAMHDLEIRGGGNLLGEAQSGHIEQVGYALYLKMLEDALNELSKHEGEVQKCELKLNVSAFLNSDLISDDGLRLELYKRLSKCESVSEVYEIEGEINDRFGALDAYTKRFLELIIVKILSTKRFKMISNFEANIQLTALNDEKIVIKAPSKDDEAVIVAILEFLRKKEA